MQAPNYSGSRVREFKGKVIERKEIREFCKMYSEHKDVTKTEFMAIIKHFNKNIALETTKNIYGITLPENIGQIVINNAGRPTKKGIDFNSSIKAGKTVYFKNWDTDNNMMRIVYYNNIRNFVKHSKLYSFSATACFRKVASSYFKKHWERCVKLNYKKQPV